MSPPQHPPPSWDRPPRLVRDAFTDLTACQYLIIFTSPTHPLQLPLRAAPAAMTDPATRGQPYLSCEAARLRGGVKVQHFSATGDKESLLESDVTDTSSAAMATSLTYLMRSLPGSWGEEGGGLHQHLSRRKSDDTPSETVITICSDF